MTPPTPNAALVAFAKAPVPGQVKTRLTELLSEGEAARLYEAFLEDLLAQYAALARAQGATLRLYYGGPRWPERLTPEGGRLYRQRGDGLGARMAAALRETFEAGVRRAVLVGTDHPTLPPAFVEQGLNALHAGPDAVSIGPSADGGFYLLGVNRAEAPRLVPALLEGRTYSHERVFADTLARIAEAGASATVLPEWYDVDTPADLRRLAADLGDEAAAERAPRTGRRIRALLEKYPSLRSGPAAG